jgi:ammonia channel protein AmtB
MTAKAPPEIAFKDMFFMVVVSFSYLRILAGLYLFYPGCAGLCSSQEALKVFRMSMKVLKVSEIAYE